MTTFGVVPSCFKPADTPIPEDSCETRTSTKRRKMSGQRLPKHLTQYADLFDFPKTTKLNFKAENKTKQKDSSLIKNLNMFSILFLGTTLFNRKKSAQKGTIKAGWQRDYLLTCLSWEGMVGWRDGGCTGIQEVSHLPGDSHRASGINTAPHHRSPGWPTEERERNARCIVSSRFLAKAIMLNSMK